MQLDPASCYQAILTRDARFDGRFFTCVTTTGIYCRPICPARPPKRTNMQFLPSAAAAQAAGFRPCLRCRPETAPSVGAWHGTANTVSRAVALIAAGALDDDDIESLAARLGMGERQLRRLFRKHLGASPIAVAQTQRFLFAKQLITETGLPLAQVALAAGFASTRRFNAVFQKHYGRPPASLRHGQPAPDAGIKLLLAYRPPYDWNALIGFLAARAIPGVEQVQPDRYARTIALGGALGGAFGTIAVSPAANRHALIATIRFPDVAALPLIVGRIRRMFDLAMDPVIVADHLSTDPHLAKLVAARPGLRVPGAWDGFELAVRGILGQQISVAAATRLAGTLVARYGTRYGETTGLSHVFPSPDRLTDPALAATLGMPRARAAAILGVAASAASDPSLFEPGTTLDDHVARLTALPGIGAWTAHYIAMRALREPDAFPATDIGLLRALAIDRVRPSSTSLLHRAASWRPWRAYAAMHLWASDAAVQTVSRENDYESAA